MTDPDDYTELEMATKTIGRVKITTDANGKTKLQRVKVFKSVSQRIADRKKPKSRYGKGT